MGQRSLEFDPEDESFQVLRPVLGNPLSLPQGIDRELQPTYDVRLDGLRCLTYRPTVPLSTATEELRERVGLK